MKTALRKEEVSGVKKPVFKSDKLCPFCAQTCENMRIFVGTNDDLREAENAREPLYRAICEHLRASVRMSRLSIRNEQVVSSILTTSSKEAGRSFGRPVSF